MIKHDSRHVNLHLKHVFYNSEKILHRRTKLLCSASTRVFEEVEIVMLKQLDTTC